MNKFERTESEGIFRKLIKTLIKLFLFLIFWVVVIWLLNPIITIYFPTIIVFLIFNLTIIVVDKLNNILKSVEKLNIR